MRYPFWIYTALDWAGIRDSRLPACADQCLAGRTTECNDIYLHCVCQNLKYMTNVQQCIAYTCEPLDTHKANLFINRICDYWNGWVRAPTKDRIFTDLRDLDLRDLDHHRFLNKRQAGSAGGISFSLVQESTGYSLSLEGTVQQTTAPSTTAFSAEATTTQETFTGAATGSSHNAATSEVTSAHTASSVTSAPAALASATTTATSSSGLSSAAKIGLGFGIPLGIIVLGLIIFGVYFFGRRQGQQQKGIVQGNEHLAQTAEGQIYEAGGEEFKGGELPTYANIAELPSSAPGSRW